MAQQIDSVLQFTKLRAALQQERAGLLKRLQQIDAALAGSAGAAPVPSNAPSPKPSGRRTGNNLNMREAIALATAGRPLKVSELAAAMQQVGYKFTSSNPTNSVGAFLYGPGGKKHFKKVGGKFSPLHAVPTKTPADQGKTAKPAMAKRKMSEEGRKNIAAAVQKRWAKVRAAKK